MYNGTNRKLNICVITPYLQGDYMGEILNHIRYICQTKQYHFTVIRTDSFGEFNLNLGLSDYDGVIIVRNAASPNLVETIQNRGIAVIAIAHDYFPLSVPILSCDNSHGMDLAFEFLRARGHEKLVFIGDATQYDLRKRYERFCELHTLHNLKFSDQQFIHVPDSLFSGGIYGGIEFLKHDNLCSGVICGAGHTALGFIKQLEEAGKRKTGNIEIVTFDNIPLMGLANPKLTRIDQNLNILANKSIALLEEIILQKHIPPNTTFISPTLIESIANPQDNNFLKTHKFEEYGIATPEYANSFIHNHFELTHNITEKNLNQLMCIVPLFQEFMTIGCLTKIVTDKFDRIRLRHIKTFTQNETIEVNADDENSTFAVENFPGRYFKEQYGKDKDTCIHFPIFLNGALWGFISMIGVATKQHSYTSFTGFTVYLDFIANIYSKNLEIDRLKSEIQGAQPKYSPFSPTQAEKPPGIDWDLEKGKIRWDSQALTLLGFTTDLEQKIYRNMEIFDRVHPEDEHAFRKQLTFSLANLQELNIVLSLKNADGTFRRYKIEGETIQEQNKKAVRYHCKITAIK